MSSDVWDISGYALLMMCCHLRMRRYLHLNDEMTTQAAIDETMIEMTGEMVEHAHMEDSVKSYACGE